MEAVLDEITEENTFRQRVADFWHLFAEQEYEIRYLLSAGNSPGKAVFDMEQLLRIAFTTPVFDLKQRDDYFELVLSPEGNGSRLYQMAYWRAQAPEELLEQWDFVVGRPPAGEDRPLAMEVEHIWLQADEISVWPILLPDGRLGIESYSEKLLLLEEATAYTAFCTLLEQCLGELCLMSNVEYVNLLLQPALEEPVLLSDLAVYIADLQMAGQLPPQDDPLGLFTSYTMEPQETWMGLRDDIYFGSTSAAALPVLNSYYTGEEGLFDLAARDGVLWGFLFYDNAGLDTEQRVHVRAALEEDLNRVLVEQGLGECIGSASGYQYAYLDCICYDWQAFLEAAYQVMDGYLALYQIPVAGFCEFRRSGQVIVLKQENLQSCVTDGTNR